LTIIRTNSIIGALASLRIVHGERLIPPPTALFKPIPLKARCAFQPHTAHPTRLTVNDDLYSNTSGSYNTATGFLRSLATPPRRHKATVSIRSKLTPAGSSNTATVWGAQWNTTTGLNNTADGVNALANSTTAKNNTATALVRSSAHIGTQNTATGASALLNNTTGSNNTEPVSKRS